MRIQQDMLQEATVWNVFFIWLIAGKCTESGQYGKFA